MALTLEALRVAYLNRETLEIVEVDVPNDAACLAATQRWWEVLIDHWERQTPPTPKPEAWECKYCCFNTCCEAVGQI